MNMVEKQKTERYDSSKRKSESGNEGSEREGQNDMKAKKARGFKESVRKEGSVLRSSQLLCSHH